MNLPAFSVKRPYAVLMIFSVILLIGIVSITKLPIDLLPKIEPPAISVLVPYPGASSSDVENDVTKYLEDALSTVEDLDELNSLSKDNLSMVTCKFKWGKNLDFAVNDVRDKLDFAKNDIKKHAPEAEEPIIFKFSSSMAPVMVISITSPSSWKDLYYIVDKEVSDALKRVEGVGSILIFGGLKRQIKVNLDWRKINGYKIPPSLIVQRLKEENIDFPLGKIKSGKREYSLRVKGRFLNKEDIENIIVGSFNGRVIYLKDIAEVEDSFEEEKSKSYQDGEKAIILIVQKQSGRNTVKVVENIKKKLDEIKKSLPSDTKISIPFNSADFIKISIKNLTKTVIIAGILVILITLLFLRKFNSSLIIATTIPFSLIVSFIFLYAGGFTINIISLMSLAIAIGMVVDNAIVVLENITRHIESGERIEEASIFGTGEVSQAITASSFTTIGVFVPLIFVSGFTGIIFKQLGFIVSATILSSLFVSITLTPMLSSKFLKRERKKETSFYRIGEVFLKKVENIYLKILHSAFSHRFLLLLILFIFLIFSVSLLKFIGKDFFPEADAARIQVRYTLNESARLEETDKVAKKIGKIYEKYVPERKNWYAFLGETEKGFGTAMGMEEGANYGEVSVHLVWKEQRKRSSKEIAEIVRREVEKIPGIEKFTVSTESPIASMLMGGVQQIEVELTGTDLEQLQNYAEKIKEKMEKIPGAVDIKVSYKKPRMEFHIKVKREKAKLLGISTSSIAKTLRTYFYGVKATKFRQGGEDFDIFVQLKEKQKYNIDTIGEMPIPTSYGKIVKLKNVAEIKLETGPVEIQRKNRKRIVKVGCDLYKRSLSDVLKDIQKKVKEINLPPGINVKYGGMAKEQKQSFQDLTQLLILGILLVYMIMVAQFESFKTPFIIFFSVPFAFVGVIWILLLTGVHFSIMSFMATVMLVGVVVNNAIVFVDYTNILRKRGYKLMDALFTAGRHRLRPILMTSFTTIFGMLPMALGKGTGGEIWQGFGVPAIGGLFLSSTITLILVPLIYSLINREVEK